MEYEFTHQPSFTQLTVTLEAGESVVAEPGAQLCEVAAWRRVGVRQRVYRDGRAGDGEARPPVAG